jgi:hypothetical protein
MGTPIVDLNSLVLKLVAILTRPDTKAYYGQMLEQFNFDRQHWLDHSERLKTANPRAVASASSLDVVEFAKYMIGQAFGTVKAPRLLDPIEVDEIVSRESPVWLYRAFDGNNAGLLVAGGAKATCSVTLPRPLHVKKKTAN